MIAMGGRWSCCWAGLFLSAIVSIWAAHNFWIRSDSSSGNPPRDSIVYRNIAPDVNYVGDKACAECHAEHARNYRRHPMGQSLTYISALADEILQASTSFEAAGRNFEVQQRDNRIFHKAQALGPDGKVIAESEVEIAVAIGAGRRGYSFVVNRNGWLTQSPISWYSDRQAWDLSPHLGKSIDQLYRPIQVQCLFCHANRVDVAPDSGNRYSTAVNEVEPIGCERCHGPGALHVQRRAVPEASAEPDDTIVNPRRLAPELREAVCEQCHLQGVGRIAQLGKQPFDYRPGLPLDQFWAVYVRAKPTKDNPKFSGQVEQMRSSRCYSASQGELGCISCHDPHELPTPQKRAEYFRDRCLRCHEQSSCGFPLTERQKKADSCIDCHMPRFPTSNIAHMVSTDHRIPRSQDQFDKNHLPAGNSNDVLISFYAGEPPGDGTALSGRNLGIALMDLASTPVSDSRRRQMAQKALPLLSTALERNLVDPDAWHAKGYALWLSRHPEEALTAFESALDLAPQRWPTLQFAGSVAAQLGSFDKAFRYWQDAANANPNSVRSHTELASLWMMQKNWMQTEKECLAALRLDPFQLAARKVLVECYVRQGLRGSADQEFAKLLALYPASDKQLVKWFKELRDDTALKRK
ncbi:MAG: multiheme c-type cytochrome [Gemmataceae bacterium]